MDNLNFKFAIFGGSFNPVHNGHVMIAQLLKEQLNVETLLIVPTKVSPFKTDEKYSASFEQRFNWLRKSFQDLKGFKISDVEWLMESDISYTYLTLGILREKLGEYPLVLIGEDSFGSFTKWKNWKHINSSTFIGVYPRHGITYDKDALLNEGLDLSRVLFPKMPIIDISSTMIRERISQHKSIRGFVPLSIENDLVDFYSGTI